MPSWNKTKQATNSWRSNWWQWQQQRFRMCPITYHTKWRVNISWTAENCRWARCAIMYEYIICSQYICSEETVQLTNLWLNSHRLSRLTIAMHKNSGVVNAGAWHKGCRLDQKPVKCWGIGVVNAADTAADANEVLQKIIPNVLKDRLITMSFKLKKGKTTYFHHMHTPGQTK